MALKARTTTEETPVDAPVGEPVQAPASDSVQFTDGEQAKFDPFMGQGGSFVINEKGERVRA
jgi:hypothetical protein